MVHFPARSVWWHRRVWKPGFSAARFVVRGAPAAKLWSWVMWQKPCHDFWRFWGLPNLELFPPWKNIGLIWLIRTHLDYPPVQKKKVLKPIVGSKEVDWKHAKFSPNSVQNVSSTCPFFNTSSMQARLGSSILVVLDQLWRTSPAFKFPGRAPHAQPGIGIVSIKACFECCDHSYFLSSLRGA